MVIIYINCASNDEAESLGKLLLERGAAGAVNIFPIHSFYRNGGNIREENENAMIVKTIDSKVQEVENIIRKNNTKNIPRVSTWSMHRINHEYKEWLSAQIA